MYNLLDQKPIIACSTGTKENTAIGVIRISGFSSLDEINSFFSIDLNSLKPNQAKFTKLSDGDKLLDEVVITYFKGPNSYNGENILEIGCHGNQLIISNIIECFTRTGDIRHASPGEFSYRALSNGKLSLSQVEGLDLLLNASSNFILNQGFQTLNGELHSKYMKLREEFLKLKATVEMSIDFLEDIGEEAADENFNIAFNKFNSTLEELHQRTLGKSSDLLSPKVVLIGETNAGKSTLFNKLLGAERSIVTDIRGTTRDYVSELVKIEDTQFNLVDTAGLRESQDQVEMIGVERSIEQQSYAFFRTLVCNPFDISEEFKKNISSIGELDLIVFTRGNDLDALSRALELVKEFSLSSKRMILTDFGPIEPLSKTGPIEPLSKTGPIEPVELGSVLSEIRKEISTKYEVRTNENPIVLDRHCALIAEIHENLAEFSDLKQNVDDIAIISSELDLIGHKISELIGIVSPDEVLNDIFSNFCIGK